MMLTEAKSKSDIRSWQSLPKNFSVASIPIESDSIQIIDSMGRVIVSEKIDTTKDWIYFVRTYNNIGGAYYDKVSF